MIFNETPIPGVYVIDLEPSVDERGLFARTYCQEEFARRGLVTEWKQCNTSFNRVAGTVRGLHLQDEPYPETKLVRCTRGAVFDVAVDVRPESPTFRRWFGIELSADNRRMFYVPNGFAHGFQTLVDNTELFYQMSEVHRPEYARGLRWSDPELGIEWPLPGAVKAKLSEKDSKWPLFGACKV